MRLPIKAEALEGSWLHSHEEDTDTEMVYRPDTFDFPPSRGRDGFTLLPEGLAQKQSIAPADGVLETHEQWKLLDEGAGPQLEMQSPSGEKRKQVIVLADSNRLVIKKSVS